MVPVSATATHCVAVGHDTELKVSVVPDVCGDHVAPPSDVARIMPPLPTVQHFVTVGHDTPYRLAEVL
jgi:hypothetical protein